MTKLIVSALLLMSVGCFGQIKNGRGLTANKNKSQYKDSSYYRVDSDTLFGNITFFTDNGVIAGEGIVIKETVWQCSKRIYFNAPKTDTVGSTNPYYSRMTGSCNCQTDQLNEHSYGLIKTSTGYKMLDFKYEFKLQ